MKKQHLTLTESDRTTLEGLLAKGTLAAKTFKRATALLELDRGKTLSAVATTLDVDYNTVAAWRNRYHALGLKCLEDAPRSGRPIVIDGGQQAKITALACSDAPEGHDRWSLRLLAEKVVEAGFCETISHTMVGKLLKTVRAIVPFTRGSDHDR
jgi:transposase